MLGKEDKFRVLVDKVLSRSNDWIMTDRHIKEIKEAGFNVVVPRMGGTDTQRVRRVAAMARENGLFYMAWMRGTLSTTTDPRVVWENGVVQDLYSPSSDQLWEWMTGHILDQAKISAENPAVIGTFLDFENYARNRVRNCYFLSYDELTLAQFAETRGLKLPALEPARRKEWLVNNHQHTAFEQYQIGLWRERCRRLREQIDAINPCFQLIVYPINTLFLEEAISSEWSAPQAPLIIADHSTYGRSGDLAHAEALQRNHKVLLRNQDLARDRVVSLQYLGGIDPAVNGADPEFCGKNAVMIAEATDGYWVFYEGPDYNKTDHPAYFKWFTWANHAISRGRFSLWQQPRQEPDPALQAQTDLLERLCGAQVEPYTTKPVPADADQTPYTVRGRNYFAVLLKEREMLRGALNARQIGKYDSPCEFSVFAPDKRLCLHGKVQPPQETPIEYRAESPGLHIIAVASGQNAAQLHVTSQYFCLLTSAPVSLIGRQPVGYFLAHPDAEDVVVTLASPSPGETVAMRVCDPQGIELARVDTVERKEVKLNLKAPGPARHEPWSLQLLPAEKGVLEDVTLTFETGCGGFLATHPYRLIVPATTD
jgi:hypothetical protein